MFYYSQITVGISLNVHKYTQNIFKNISTCEIQPKIIIICDYASFCKKKLGYNITCIVVYFVHILGGIILGIPNFHVGWIHIIFLHIMEFNIQHMIYRIYNLYYDVLSLVYRLYYYCSKINLRLHYFSYYCSKDNGIYS